MTWALERDAEGLQRVRLGWAECAKLAITEPGRSGFDPAGVTWRLAFPLPRGTDALPGELA
jgi:hypothetical protein